MGSLAIFAEAGIERVRAKSLAQTDYLIGLIEGSGLLDAPYGYRIGTPRDHARRGGHVAVEHDAGLAISHALKARGVVVDFRKPDVVRLAPVALYTTYEELWRAVRTLKAIVEEGEQIGMAVSAGHVT
jgi:kynureninase